MLQRPAHRLHLRPARSDDRVADDGDADVATVIPFIPARSAWQARALASDLEHVHRGLREWDLAGGGPAVLAGYAAEAERLGQPALQERLLAVTERGRELQLLAVLHLDAELPGLLDGLAPMVRTWREKPPLADLLP